MSRLPTLMDTPTPLASSSRQSPCILKSTQPIPELQFPYRLFLPRHYEPHYEYPLVVWLHSDHSSEYELDGVMESLSDQNYIAIAPRAMKKSRRSERLYRWGTSSTDLALADEMVWECVHQAAQTLSVNTNNVFLAGFGNGGTIAQWIGLKNPQIYAGVVSINGGFPVSRRALSDWKRTRDLQVLFMQTAGSTLCTDSQWNDTIKLAHSAGLKYRFWQMLLDQSESGDCDGLDIQMLQAANRFMMGIVTDSPISLEPEEVFEPSLVPSYAFGIN